MFTQAISSPNAPKALGPYSQAIKLGDFVYLSGQIPMDPSTGAIVEGGIQ
ncbi:MAG: Rid family hydrolase, partial [Erysipelotrichaceae bacterium]